MRNKKEINKVDKRMSLNMSYSTHQIKQHRNMLILMTTVPLVIFCLTITTLITANTVNRRSAAQTACTRTISGGSISSEVNALSSGQVLCLQGTFNQSVTFTKAGVTLASANSSNKASINGQVWFKSSAQNAKISNLNLRGSGIAPPSVIIEANGVIVQGNDITNPGTRGICVQIGITTSNSRVNGVLIDRNRIHNCGTNNKLDHGIYLAHTDASPVTRITNNYIYDNAMFGMQYYPDAQGTIVEYNVFDGNPSGITFSGDEGLRSNGNIFRYNIISNSDSSVLGTFYNVNSWWGSGAGSGNRVENNCLYGAKNGNFQPGLSGVIVGSNILNQNPLYVDRANKNFILQPGSPCAGKGPQTGNTVPNPVPTPPPPAPTPTPTPPTPTPTPAPQPSPSPTPTPPSSTPPVTVPGAGNQSPVPIPQHLPVEKDGTITADFNGDGVNEVVRDVDQDGQINPYTEVVINSDGSPGAASMMSSSEPFYEELSDSSSTIAVKPGPFPEVRIPKPVAYTFLIAGGITVVGIGTYLAIIKLAILAGLRSRLGI